MDNKDKVPLLGLGEDQVQDHWRSPNMHLSIGSDEIHPRVLRELDDAVAKPFPFIPEKPWHSGKVPHD